MTLGTCSCSPVGDVKVIDIYIVKNSLTFLTLIPLHLYVDILKWSIYIYKYTSGFVDTVDLSGTARVKQDISWSFPIFYVNTYFRGKWLNDMERPKISIWNYFRSFWCIYIQNSGVFPDALQHSVPIHSFFICVRIYSIKISRLKFRKFQEYFIVHSRLGFEKNIIWCVEKL